MKGALPRTIMRAVAAIMIFAAVCVAVFAALSLFGGSIFSASSDQGQTDTPESTSSWSVAQASLVVTAEEQEVAEAEAAGDAVRVIEGQDGGDVAAGQILLTIDEAVSQEDLIQALCGAGVEAYDAQAVSTSLGDGNVLVLVEYEGDQSPEDACERAASLQFVSYAEANHALELADVQQAATSDDAYLDRQWEHDSIGLSAAWDLSKAEGKVSVAVIDSGVDYDHPDLESNLLLDYAKDTHTNTVGKAAVNDASGHGTHVCGIISAVANNAIGVAGASYNANILPIDASSKDSSGSTRLLISDIVKAIDYVISLKEDPASPDSLKAIRVVNMSFGGDESDNTKAFSDAIQRAQDAGLLVVAAAGNTGNKGNDAMYPAAYDGVIGVGALYSTGSSVAWASYSYHGSCVDISAPGSSIYSTALNGGYSYLSGTSMACPVVSSVAALAFAANSELDADDVSNILVETAMDLGDVGRDDYYGAGEVKADAAVAKALAAAEGDAGVQTARATPRRMAMTLPPRARLPATKKALEATATAKKIQAWARTA